MVKSLMRELALAIQAKSGASPAVFIWLIVAALAAVLALPFFCVAAYVWLEGLFGGIYAGLIVAGFFLAVALIAALFAAMARRAVRQRAVLERAARARAGSWMLDPKILTVAVEAGRKLGWQRLVPVALLGFMAAQWAREHREQNRARSGEPPRD
jgi:Ca2+/Na+ antiporter